MTARRAVSALPSDQAEIIMLRVVAGLDNRAVVRLVGKSPGAGGSLRTAAFAGSPRWWTGRV
jgi:RNA polymerase sigma-70 factor, ECF subfamily